MHKGYSKHDVGYKDLEPAEVKNILDAKNGTRLIDVREEWEHKIAHIENSELIPLSNFMKHLKDLNEDDELIFYCHTGARSANVCMFLAERGFKNLINLKGGIEAWSNDIDPSVPRYK